ncbi:hypothetical protein RclHR1_10370011 [Rhizophagus clarus]|uniref:Uncharacterized protein n=1 Tax=Rhizophagus clarus TaxID=94130 RepID=A0A2Z6QFL8_9GLOM|nr:hypothetical protein RclHR1_10370011 [Rhizophagus clarus]
MTLYNMIYNTRNLKFKLVTSEYKASKGKLSFKGDRDRKKKKKRKAEESIEEDGNQEGWVLAETQGDLIGPLFLVFNSEPLSCLYCSEKDHSIGVQSLPSGKQLSTIEPEDIASVFVGSRIVGNTGRISLKTFDEKYLASDKFGVITAEREAIGPQEEWTPIIKSDGIALQSIYDKFLSIDEIADGGYNLRADVETVGFYHSIGVQSLPSGKQLSTIEPEDIASVFVGSRIVGNTGHISLKIFDEKYLASDKFGVITAEREAIGPQEEWTPIIKSDGIALQSIYDKFLSIDEIADGGYNLRADVETVGFCETWKIKCQARFRKKVKSTKKETKPISEYEIE